MSYFADHLAWQQRVNQEFKSNCHQQDAQGDPVSQMMYSQYPDMVNYMIIQQKAQNKDMRDKAKYFDKMSYEEMRAQGKAIAEQNDINGSFYKSAKGAMGQSYAMQGVLNSGDYGYMSKTRMSSRQGQRLQSAGQSSRRSNITQQSVKSARHVYDQVSNASRASAASANRVRVATAGSRKLPSQYSSNIIPTRQERFNENVEVKSQVSRQPSNSHLSSNNLAAFTKQRSSLKVIGTPNLNATSKDGRSQATRSIFSQNSRFSARKEDVRSSAGTGQIRVRKAENHKRRIMDVVNQLNEDELEKVSEMLRVSEALSDKDNLDADAGAEDGETRQEDDCEADEAEDTVNDFIEKRVRVVLPDEMSSVSRAASMTSKSAVASLTQQLADEKEARQRLERELQQLVKVSSDIHRKLTGAEK